MVYKHQDLSVARRYYWLKEERSEFQGLQNENFIEAVLEVKKLKDYAESPCFCVNMPQYKQSNREGMYMLVDALHELRSEVIFTIDEEGKLGQVLNLPEIANKWIDLKYKIDKKFLKKNPNIKVVLSQINDLFKDGDRFSSALRYAAPYITLFPGIHRRKETNDAAGLKGYSELPNFLAAPKVPIITQEEIRLRSNKTIEIQVSGVIDQANFEQDKLTAMIRILKNRPRVPTALQLNYKERILLDEQHWLLHNVCMSLAYVPGTLYREEKSIIKSL